MLKMKAEVIHVISIYLGEAGEGDKISDVCEVLLFECSLPEDVAVMIPFNNSSKIVLKKGDIRTCFHDAKTNLISFDLSKPLDISLPYSCQSLTLKLNQNGHPIHREHKREFYLFLDFAIRNFYAVKLQPMKKPEDFSEIFAAEDCLETDIYSDYESLRKRSMEEVKFKFYIRPYVYLLNQNSCNEREFKKFIRSQDNLPAFFRYILKLEDLENIELTLHSFLRRHICHKWNCIKVTHKKCSICKVAPYCSIKCQTQSWTEHKDKCKMEVTRAKMYEKSRETILDQLRKQFWKEEEPVSLKVFIEEVELAMFVLHIPIYEKTTFMDEIWGYGIFRGLPKCYWIGEVKSLVKKEYTKMRKKLSFVKVVSQMSAAWNLGFDDLLDMQ